MKYFKHGIKLLFVALLMMSTACSSSNSVKQSNKEGGTEGSEYMTLDDHIRRLNGVRIVGSGDYAKVMIRARGFSNASVGMGKPEGKRDINLGDSNKHQPLFVLDGQKMGRDYPTVRDMVTTGQIKSVRLLPDSEASQYGSQSGAGVIEIITKAGAMKNN